ncbi:hypothetical protein CC78DRAFT_570449 [Lojkania enalia]|uniref:RanBP2-type domain-containing protein n=1 Tax=Lojkania enalia TaxID=147567 RepID=A0A9P4K269_9PLEO|nr:hypothetical protein CC78DRAFT_570449 [Didymosphaeria enalia]
MDIPRGHAMLPLNEADFLDFVFNYFKAEYAPIRSFFSTATAEPRQPQRWVSMGHELAPLSFRPANAQAQKDLESLDYFVRKWNLDSGFVRGIVIRFAKYEIHERLEKKLFESCRLDLMVRKALKEKHLIDALWPSPALKTTPQELLQHGVRVRSWYGDMFNKYFRHLHAVDDFSLRPEVDAKIKASGTLILVPYVDHLVFGAVDPIMPIVAKGAGYANATAWKQKDKAKPFGEPDRFEIRFDAPAEVTDTYTRSVVRQCQCLKCGTKRDVTIAISVDPSPGPIAPQPANKEQRPSNPNSSPRRQTSKAAQRYSPGYHIPGNDTRPTPHPISRPPVQEPTPQARASSPVQMKQCPRCTFLNHPELASCEICAAELPDKLVTKPPSPSVLSSKPLHSHSASVPPLKMAAKNQDESLARPPVANRQSLSSTLFSIFPFSQQHQTEHHAKLPPTQPVEDLKPRKEPEQPKSKQEAQPHPILKHEQKHQIHQEVPTDREAAPATPTRTIEEETESPLSQEPEMAMMALTPPPTSDHNRQYPTGMPQNLMDDYVPVSPSFGHEQDEEDAGWGEMSKEEAKDDSSDDEEAVDRREGMVDLDEVAREEMGVWGDGEENDQ